MNKVLVAAAFIATFGVGFGQRPGAPTDLPQVGPSAYHDYGPNIEAPFTNTLHFGDAPRTACTTYLIYTGPFRPGSLPTPQLVARGPRTRGHFQFSSGYTPKDVIPAYGFTLGTGGQDAIAIVDAFHSNYTLSDFNTFSQAFSLPVETSTTETNVTNKVFSIVYASGTKPPEDTGWALEMALDVEWAHAMAPNAKIYLVCAASSGGDDLNQAIAYAVKIPGIKQVVREVSQSFISYGENSGEQSGDSVYNDPKQGAVYFAGSGDIAGSKGYPSMSPFVVDCGGTSVQIQNGKVVSESVWADAGAGPSTVVPIPAFQSSNPGISAVIGKFRNSPDVSSLADPNTGVAVHETYNGGWLQVGGTSLATPLSAAIHNRRGQFKVPTGTGLTGTQLELARFYSHLDTTNKPKDSLIRDIVSGSITVSGSSPVVTYPTGVGYDLASGTGEQTGNYAPAFSQLVDGAAVNPAAYGRYLNGILNAPNGSPYNIQSTLVTGLGQVAGTEIDFSVKPPTGYKVDSATLKLGSKSVSSSTIQIYFYNWTTKAWDYTAAFPMFGSTITSTYNLDVSKYVSTSNQVHVLTRSVLPTRLGTGTYLFGIGAATLQAGADATG